MKIALSFLAASLLLASAQAQQQRQVGPGVYRTTGAPQFAGVYHPSTGFQPATSQTSRLGPKSLYNNTTLTNYYAIPPFREEWIDEGQFVARNSTAWEQVNGFEYSYCSTDSNPNGIGTNFNFYDEVAICNGPVSQVWPAADCSYQFFGMPGGSNGNLACWTIAISLSGYECDFTTDASGNQLFGFGLQWTNPNSGPWLARGGLGNDNSFVAFDTQVPNANAGFVGCFWFGGTPHAGFAMELYGNPAETRSYVHAAGPGADDNLVLILDESAQVGNTVTFSVLDGPFGAPVASHLWISSNRVDRRLPLIDGHELAEYSTRVYRNNSATGLHSLVVPNRSGTWYSQAAVVHQGMATQMSNALEHVVL